MSESEKKPSITRRSFTVAAAVAATATLFPAGTGGQDAATSQSDAMGKLSPGAKAEVEAKAGEIFRKYGSRLSEEQKKDVRKVLAETQDGLEKMRNFVLTNGDQPATVFEFHRGSGRNSNA